MANLVRVLEATLKGPRRSSQRPTNPRPHTDQGGTASAGDASTEFQPGTGPGLWVPESPLTSCDLLILV